MMSNNFSIFLSEKGRGEIVFDPHRVNVEYDLIVYQAVLTPELLTVICLVKVINPDLSIATFLNRREKSVLLKLSDGEQFEAWINSSQNLYNGKIYELNVIGTNNLWERRKENN